MSNSRRIRIYLVRERELLEYLSEKHVPMFMQVCYSPESNIPDGAVVQRVDYLWDRHAFALHIQHGSFDEITEGVAFPIISEFISFKYYACKLVEINGKYYYEVPEEFKPRALQLQFVEKQLLPIMGEYCITEEERRAEIKRRIDAWGYTYIVKDPATGRDMFLDNENVVCVTKHDTGIGGDRG